MSIIVPSKSDFAALKGAIDQQNQGGKGTTCGSCRCSCSSCGSCRCTPCKFVPEPSSGSGIVRS